MWLAHRPYTSQWGDERREMGGGGSGELRHSGEERAEI